MKPDQPLQSLSDAQLLQSLGEVLRDSRRVEADLVAHIAEVDERRLFLGQACSSMFSYCLEVLHLSEPETNLRLTVARASRRHPALLDLLREGRLHLSAIALLAPHLTEQNRDEVLRRATHLSKRRVEELVAELAPRPDVPTLVRKLPERGANLIRGDAPRLDEVTGAQPRLDQAAGTRPRLDQLTTCTSAPDVLEPVPPGPQGGLARRDPLPVIEPLSPARYKVQFTASAALRAKLERLQVLMRSAVPYGDLARLIEDAVTEKIERLEARRLAAVKTPRTSVARSDTRPGPRHIPAAVKRAVRERDKDRCSYVDTQGRRCTERRDLQFHHRHPHGYGGDRSPRNIAQMCRAHNAHEAEADFGKHWGPTISSP